MRMLPVASPPPIIINAMSMFRAKICRVQKITLARPICNCCYSSPVRRLMGIKSGSGPPPQQPKPTEETGAGAAAVAESPSAAVTTEKTAAMFREQEEQYERARAITHTAKGLGLGFSSLGPP